ncbi:MAG: Gfo/Idh/MocA family oxidoreductase [Pseudomonadota bacterium]|nr:Gfo/Idh/MocA family oxidoreductase [Pseudomonadota bacterium]
MSNSTLYGIIGAGMMAQEHIRNIYLLEGASVTAVCDPEKTSLSWSESTLRSIDGAELSQVQYFTDHRDMLASGAVDALIIASPNFTHIDVLRDTLQTDLPHLVEKPLCTTLEDALEIEERVKGFDPVFWVGLEYRYMPPVARMIERAHAGDVGAMKMLSIREHRFPFLPKVGNWNRFNENTGGTFVEKCCHFFDLMRFILKDEPVAVMGMGGQAVNHLSEEYDGRKPDIFDHGFAVVEFASGAKAQLDLCMFAEGSENQEEISLVGDTAKLEVKIPEGVITYMPRRPKNPTHETVEIDDKVLEAGSHFGSSYFQHLDFQKAIREGTPSLVTAHDGRMSVQMGLAAQISMTERRWVEMSELA